MSIFNTKEEKMSAFVGCLKMAECEGGITEKDHIKLSNITDYIGLTEDELTQCLEQPETIQFVVPSTPAGCQGSVMCLIAVAMENGKISSPKQALMLHAACNSYGVSDEQCSGFIQELAASEAQHKAAS